MRVAEDGELLVRGGQVFARLLARRRGDRARRSTADGWLRTGDLGEIDDEGFVRVTGRKKEILVTAGGKNVAPARLEDQLRAHPLVSQCLVVGDGRPFVAALVTLDPRALAPWADGARQARRRRPTSPTTPTCAPRSSPPWTTRTRSVSQAESIRRFASCPGDWTEEAGQLTPSLKLRRTVVMREFRREVDALYE